MARHKDLVGAEAIHQPQYIQAADPGAVGAWKVWIDITVPAIPIFYYRNAGNAAWVVFTPGLGAHVHSGADITTGTVVAARIDSLPASQITSGVLAMARLATGTPDGTKFVRDDGTLQTPAGGGGGGAPTSPVSGYELWAKADGTLTKDGSDRVTAWGQANQFIYNGTIGQAPVYQASGLNGKPFCRITNASNQFMFYRKTTTSNVFSTFVVLVDRVGTATCRLLFMRNGIGDYTDTGHLFNYRDTVGFGHWRNGQFQAFMSNTGNLLGMPIIEVCHQNADYLGHRLNGAAHGNLNQGALNSDIMILGARCGGDTVTPAVNSCGNYDFYEILIYLTALTAEEIVLNEQYLANKYKIAIATTP